MHIKGQIFVYLISDAYVLYAGTGIILKKRNAMQKIEMSSLWQVMQKLRNRGFTHDFTMSDDGKMLCTGRTCSYEAEDLKIIGTYRFEGESDPADMSVLYAIQTTDGLKGLYVDAYGATSGMDSPKFNDFIRKVKIVRTPKHHKWGHKVAEFFKNLVGVKKWSY